MNVDKAARAYEKIAEGYAELALAVLEQPGRVPSAAPADDLPPLTDEDAPPTADQLLEGVLAVTGGELVAAPVAQAKQESAFTGCPAHTRPWTKGKFGDYCQAMSEDPDWSNGKGFCTVTPRSAGAWLKQHPKVAA